MMIDTHSHLNFKAYDKDREEVIKRTQKEGVVLIDVGTKFETSKRAVKLAEKNKNIYAAIGMHPIHIKTDLLKIKMDEEEGAFKPLGEEFNYENYKELALSSKQRVVAIGEIGLDFYYKPKTKARLEEFKELQKKVFLQQLDLARELDLPAIIHCRMAHDEILKILDSQIAVSYKKLRGVVHCFTGTVEQMKQYLNLGFYIGINGIIFKFYPVKSALQQQGGAAASPQQFNGVNLDQAVKECPPDKILTETDCPYLTPPAEGKDKRNEPVFVKHIIQKIADIKGLSFNRVAQQTFQNAKDLFKI